jgi:ribosomal protein S18 acetylase RimI-like enzyme
LITIRPAGVSDVVVLRDMLQALSRHTGGPGDAGSLQSLLEHGFGPRPLFYALIAEDAAGAVGMIIYYPDFSTLRGQSGLYVQDLYLAPAARGAGLGPMLLRHATLAAQRDWGAVYLTLAVEAENLGAVRFYQNLGFRPRGYDFLILDKEGLASLLL